MKRKFARRQRRSLELLEGRTLLAVDFSLATFSDTQYTVESFPETFKTQTAWIAAHRSDPAYKVAFFTHQGDMLRRGYSDLQAANASAALANLDTAGVPYAVAIGNHDYDNQFDDLDRHVSSANFTKWFGDARYGQQLAAGDISEYGSSLDQRNHYHVFSVIKGDGSSQSFLVLSLEWQVPAAAQAWGQGVIDAHPGVPMIVSTHEYLAGSAGSRTTGTPVDAGLIGAQNGSSLWTNFVTRNDQIFLVLSGHTGATWNRAVTNAAGHTVIEASADYEGAQPNGGDGWMQTLAFDLAGGSLTIAGLKPTSATTQQAGGSTTYAINFAQRFAFTTPPVTPVTPGPNVAPVAGDVSLATPESKAVTFDPVAGATDGDGDAMRAILTSLPPHGALYVNDNGMYTYTPDAKFVGVDTFTYVVSDGKANSTPVTVSVNVRPAAPVYYYPSAESTVAGTRGGSLANVQSSDGVVETVREVISSTAADVDQRYTFTNVAAGTDLVLGLNAWRSFSNPGTGDEYHPQYSTNGSTWIDLTQIVARSSRDVTRTRSEANEPYQMWSLPSTVSGTVYIRLTDVNTSGTETVDTLSVDEIFLRSGVTFPSVSVAATANGAERLANDGPAVFTVTRTGSGASIRNPLTVTFDLSGTATAGDDYATPAAYTVTIPAGQSSATFSVTPIADDVVEDPETLTMTLSAGGAYDLGGSAAATATIADLSSDTTPPSAPGNLAAVTTSTTVGLTWSASSDDVGVVAYDVTRNGVLIATVAGTSFTDSGRASNTAYGYAVTARDDAGNVSAAATIIATTRLPAPSLLSVSKVKNRGQTQAKLSWRDNSASESGFYVYTSRDGITWTRMATVAALSGSGGTATWTSATLASGTWRFRVTTFNANGESDASDVVSVLI